MCGFAGAAAVSSRWLIDAPALVERMRGVLVHRGPDGSGQWGDGNVVLGHQRLSILDVSDAGAQPMFSASGRFVIVFNGEIYNFKELAERLAQTGWLSVSSSDTEVLIECIERWGLEATLDQVDGMFAFALYDRQRKELVLCRDRFGEKPLYYGVQNGVIYFASELRSFDVPGGPELLLDRRATADYFRYGFIPAPLSIYHGFFKVRPAHLIRVDLSGGAVAEAQELPSQPYWTIPVPSDGVATSEEELRHVLRRSVNRRLISDRPLGAFLSGGIDSSLTCALAAEVISGSLKTFTMSWTDSEYDESDQAQSVATALGSIHCTLEVTASDVSEIVFELGRLLDEPHADSSIISTYLVAKEARKSVVVALSGDGGDELFAGYNRHRWLIHSHLLRRRIPQWARDVTDGLLQMSATSLGALSRPIHVSRRPRLIADKSRKLGRALSARNNYEAYEAVISGNRGISGKLNLSAEITEAINSDDRTLMLWGIRAADVSAYLSDDVLAKVDRTSMAVSLETRTPFLDPSIADIAFRLSYSDLIGGSKGKLPLRNFLNNLLPNCDFSQPKTGFGTPIASLLRGHLAEFVELAFANFSQRPLPKEISGVNWGIVLKEFLAGSDSNVFQIWSVLVFELWIAEGNRKVNWAV